MSISLAKLTVILMAFFYKIGNGQMVHAYNNS